ncbi:MAG: mitochondrial 37S ribosomal protein nam9 [Watsoniomyces obsoletus]|nr:MAG: mitochondrial 37S ribosomal protein nam9 [Watsoniomyces obsoletus]
MSSLDVSSKRSLERHPGNPNSENISSHSAEASVSTKPMFSRSTTVAAPVSRTTLKETIAARKREAAASRGLPSRPESAQSAFSPSLKKVQSSSNMSSSLASAPMRPMRAPRRPEIHRPATADPFSRRMVKASSPGITNTAAAAMVKGKSKQESPATRSIRNRPTRADSSPAQSDSMSSDAGGSRDIRRDEELTMVIPRVNMDRVLLPVLQESEPVSEDQSRSPVKEIPFHPKTPSTTIRRVEPVVEEEEIPLRAANGTAKEESSVNGTGSVDEPAVVPATPELQVYEDPTESNERQTSPARLIRPTVLEERTVNEPLRNGTSPISSRSSPQGLKTPQTSPRKKSVQERTTDTPQGRRLLNNVISQVKAGQTDISRLRRLQSGLEGNTDLWPDTSSFEQLLSSLLDIVASNEPSGITTTDHNDLEKLRIQALVTIRSMFKNSPDRFSSLYPSTLKTLLRARGLYVESSPVVEALAETAERITQSMPSESCIEAILDVLAPSTQEDSSSIPSSATLSLGFDLISTSLERGSSTTSNTASPALPDVLASRLGHLAIRCLDDLDPSLRHSVTTACVGLYERMESHARFWKVMHAVREDQRMLITYHIVRKESQHQRQDQSASSAVVAPVVSATATATLVS